MIQLLKKSCLFNTKPISSTRCCRQQGNLAPDGAIVKIAGLEKLSFTGKARCFDNEEEAFKAVTKKEFKKGEVIVIRYEGPRGEILGMREMLTTTAVAIDGVWSTCSSYN